MRNQEILYDLSMDLEILKSQLKAIQMVSWKVLFQVKVLMAQFTNLKNAQ